jgi:ferric-dicitrate binding protein FerR (iron transport regulator)
MSPHDDDREDATVNAADEARGREAMALLSEPPARAAFRDRLSREFVAGTLASPGHPAHAAPRVLEAASRPTRTPATLGPRRSWREIVLRWGLPAAAAAAVAAVSALNHGEAWRVAGASGEGIAVVDGRPVPLQHTAELAAALRGGTRVRIPSGCTLEIESPGALRIELTAETDATVPATPGRWFGRRVSSEIQAGECRITTGPRFRGAQLAIATPSAHVEVTGTTLAVILDPQGTCVCVHEGTVRVGRDRDDMVDVPAGRRRFVYNDERPSEMGDIRDNEVPELERLRQGAH